MQTPFYDVTYYDCAENRTVIKTRLFTFTLDNIIIRLKKGEINNLTIKLHEKLI